MFLVFFNLLELSLQLTFSFSYIIWTELKVTNLFLRINQIFNTMKSILKFYIFLIKILLYFPTIQTTNILIIIKIYKYLLIAYIAKLFFSFTKTLRCLNYIKLTQLRIVFINKFLYKLLNFLNDKSFNFLFMNHNIQE